MSQKRVDSTINRLTSMSFGYVNSQRAAATKATNRRLVERELWRLELLDAALDYAVTGFHAPTYKNIMQAVNDIVKRKT